MSLTAQELEDAPVGTVITFFDEELQMVAVKVPGGIQHGRFLDICWTDAYAGRFDIVDLVRWNAQIWTPSGDPEAVN